MASGPKRGYRKFVLYGIRGVYNYGTEAIVRGSVRILRQRWPQSRIVYASFRPDADRALLSDIVGLEIVDVGHVSLAPRLRRRLKRYLGWNEPYALPLHPAIYEDADAVLCIGGDLYTLPAWMPRSLEERFFSPIVETGEQVLARGIPWILWAASVGPFEGVPTAKAYFVRHLQRIPLITVRDPLTRSYLAELGVANARAVGDPAFVAAAARDASGPRADTVEASRESALLGVNLSPIALSYVAKSKARADELLHTLKESLGYMLKSGHRLVLVPHVDAKWLPSDDDHAFLAVLGRQLGGLGDVKLLDRGLGFLGTKEVLKQCDIVLAARMHCGINAVTIGRPTVFLGYSEKARGMSRYIYGNEEMFVRLDELGTNRTHQILQIVGRRATELAVALSKRQAQWYAEAMSGADWLSEVI